MECERDLGLVFGLCHVPAGSAHGCRYDGVPEQIRYQAYD